MVEEDSPKIVVDVCDSRGMVSLSGSETTETNMTVSELIEIIQEERDLWLEEKAEAGQREVERDLVDELEGV